jgi:hypothetical protein
MWTNQSTVTLANAESIWFLAINRQTYYVNYRRSTLGHMLTKVCEGWSKAV